jgi:hypothetical protein
MNRCFSKRNDPSSLKSFLKLFQISIFRGALNKGATFEEFARHAAKQMIALAMESEIIAVIEPYQNYQETG